MRLTVVPEVHNRSLSTLRRLHHRQVMTSKTLIISSVTNASTKQYSPSYPTPSNHYLNPFSSSQTSKTYLFPPNSKFISRTQLPTRIRCRANSSLKNKMKVRTSRSRPRISSSFSHAMKRYHSTGEMKAR